VLVRFFPLFLCVQARQMFHCRWLLLLLALLSCAAGRVRAVGAAGAVDAVTADGSGNLLLTPPAGRAVLVQGVDVPASLAAADQRLRALETALKIEVVRFPARPTGPASAVAARIGQDLLGNLLLNPAPGTK
jgi:hypothetical protein